MQRHPIDLATSWLEQAKRDLDSGRYLFDGSRFDAACFASQQAAEKALKAVLVWLAGDGPVPMNLRRWSWKYRVFAKAPMRSWVT